MKKYLFIILFLIPHVSYGAISLLEADAGSFCATCTTLSYSHTSAVDAALFVGVAAQTGPSVTSVSFNGGTMTELWDLRDSLNINLSGGNIILATTTGSKTILVTMPGNQDILSSAGVTFSGVDTTTMNRTPVTAQDTGVAAVASVNVSNAVTGDVIIDSVVTLTGSITVGANQTSLFEDDAIAGGGSSQGISSQNGVDGGVMSWSGPALTYWAIGGVALIPASSGGGSTPTSSDDTGWFQILE